MKKKLHKIAYLQNWGTYTNQTLVVVGMNHAEILAYMKKIKTNPKMMEAFNTNERFKDLSIGGGSNGITWVDDGRTILWLEDWENDWKHWDTLVHECFHLVFHILAKDKGMGNEDEGMAYQQEYLFKNIRRKLFELTDKKKK